MARPKIRNGKDRAGAFWDRALSIALALVLLGTLGALAYTVAVPAAKESFTEFYILGPEGQAQNYPAQLMPGEEGKVVVGVINREQKPAVYRIEVRVNGVLDKEVSLPVLEPGEKWERMVSFDLAQAGARQKVEFLLYKQGQAEVYQNLHLWVDVQ